MDKQSSHWLRGAPLLVLTINGGFSNSKSALFEPGEPTRLGGCRIMIRMAVQLHDRAQRPNIFIKIPGTSAGIPAIEESIFRGVPVNVTLLFSREQYIAAAEAYMRGIERRIASGLDPKVDSVASIFISRWDEAVKDKVPAELRNRLGIGIAKRTIRLIANCWTRPAHGNWPRPAPGGNACFGPVPALRNLMPPTPCTSTRLRRRIRSIPCLRRRCSPLPIMGK